MDSEPYCSTSQAQWCIVVLLSTTIHLLLILPGALRPTVTLFCLPSCQLRQRCPSLSCEHLVMFGILAFALSRLQPEKPVASMIGLISTYYIPHSNRNCSVDLGQRSLSPTVKELPPSRDEPGGAHGYA